MSFRIYPNNSVYIGPVSITGPVAITGYIQMTGTMPISISEAISITGYVKVAPTGVSLQSSGNTTRIPLNANATFNGEWEDVNKYSSIAIVTSSDVSGSLYYDNSSTNDGSIIEITRHLSITGASTDFHSHNITPVCRYFRVRLVNGPIAQSYLSLQTAYKTISPILTTRLGTAIDQHVDSTIVKSILAGQTSGGNIYDFVNVSNNKLHVSIQEPTSAFGEISVASLTPITQLDFIYGHNNQTMTGAWGSGGGIEYANGMVSVSTSTNATGYGKFTTKKYIKYRNGQGVMSRFTTIFATGVANNYQYAGLGTPSLDNGYFFGYDGTAFGIFHKNSRNPATGTTFYAQSTWNTDTLDGSNTVTNTSGILIDPTKGNVYQIKYQYLGFGPCIFSVMNSHSAKFIDVHHTEYSNTAVVPALGQSSLALILNTTNWGNTSNVIIKSGSVSLFVEGTIVSSGPKYGVNAYKSVSTTETNVITLKAATTYNNVNSVCQIRINNISFGSDGGNNVSFLNVHLNGIVAGVPSFTPISGTTSDNGNSITNGNSVISYDTVGTTLTNGTIVFSTINSTNQSTNIDVSSQNIFLAAGDVLVFSVYTIGTATTASISVNWIEDI